MWRSENFPKAFRNRARKKTSEAGKFAVITGGKSLAHDRRDAVWTMVGLLVIFIASATILALARYLDPRFEPSPWFLVPSPGWHGWVFAAWIPLFIANILGEELRWRGYVLPRLCRDDRRRRQTRRANRWETRRR